MSKPLIFWRFFLVTLKAHLITVTKIFCLSIKVESFGHNAEKMLNLMQIQMGWFGIEGLSEYSMASLRHHLITRYVYSKNILYIDQSWKHLYNTEKYLMLPKGTLFWQIYQKWVDLVLKVCPSIQLASLPHYLITSHVYSKNAAAFSSR